MSKTMSEQELSLAVMDAVGHLDECEAASSKVSRQTSYDFYRRVAEECSDRAATIRDEMESEETEEDEC